MKWEESMPWMVAIFGWFVAHAFSEARERRKDIRSQIEKIIEKLSAIEELAITFHTNTEHNAGQARELTSQIQRLEKMLSRIQILDMHRLNYPIITLRRAITLNNFDSGEFKTQSLNCDLVQEITESSLIIEDEIEKQYQDRYPASFPYFKLTTFSNLIAFWR